MFDSMRKRVDDTVNTNDIETIIGRNTCITGQISGGSNIRVDGRVDGGIDISGNAVIGETGIINGDIKAASLIVSGTVTGNANVEGNLSIYATGQLVGDISVHSFNIADGGVFKGRSDMEIKTVGFTPTETE